MAAATPLTVMLVFDGPLNVPLTATVAVLSVALAAGLAMVIEGAELVTFTVCVALRRMTVTAAAVVAATIGQLTPELEAAPQ